ncbi:hypothetical protein LIER_09811 [Lithospermum erythrorhizon]|uniref:Gag-pol polyprotein n=1 Tax=Lithospermum erythrorhizon TaxID=34254 RepID=A0AAV3PL09_LITER
MEGVKEGTSITHTKTWKVVLTGWVAPTQNNAGVVAVKQEVDWTAVEGDLSMGNSKALNAIICVVDAEVFKLISSCNVAKEAWEILETDYEEIQKRRPLPHTILKSRT